MKTEYFHLLKLKDSSFEMIYHLQLIYYYAGELFQQNFFVCLFKFKHNNVKVMEQLVLLR